MEAVVMVSQAHAGRASRTLLRILEIAHQEIEEMCRLGLAHPSLVPPGYLLSDEALNTLRVARNMAAQAITKVRLDPKLEDLPLADVCTSQKMVLYLALRNIRTVMELWGCDDGTSVEGVIDQGMYLGAPHQFYLKLFISS